MSMPRLPEARGKLSSAVLAAFREAPGEAALPVDAGAADPLGEDLQLALQLCYEPHYQGLPGVDARWEWDPDQLRLRASMERSMLAAIRDELPGGDDAEGALRELLVEPVDAYGPSHYLRDEGTWDELREYLVHRSIYHLKEADPHAWVIPRLTGRPKAALVAVEFDEFGGGRADDVHAKLYADLLDGAGLDSRYLRYLDNVPAPMIATVNLMSMFGLHRAMRGALIGHFAAAEITTAPSAERMAAALRRLSADARCVRFFTEHIEADAVHEQIMRHDVVGGLLAQEPELAADVVLGVQAAELLEGRLADHLLGAWRSGRSSLRSPL